MQYAINHEIVISYVNDAAPGIYTLNRNYSVYEVSDAGGEFALYYVQTVRRLIIDMLCATELPAKSMRSLLTNSLTEQIRGFILITT